MTPPPSFLKETVTLHLSLFTVGQLRLGPPPHCRTPPTHIVVAKGRREPKIGGGSASVPFPPPSCPQFWATQHCVWGGGEVFIWGGGSQFVCSPPPPPHFKDPQQCCLLHTPLQ